MSSSNQGSSLDYLELPSKLMMEPKPQQYPEQSLEDYLRYYDRVVDVNIWDDLTAALFLPQFIQDPNFKQLISRMLPEQRRSYRWLKQTLLEAAKYRPPSPERPPRPESNLYELYWDKIGSLRSHLHGDLNGLRTEVKGLMGETFQHLSTRMQDSQKFVKSILPPVVGQTVYNVVNKISDSMDSFPGGPRPGVVPIIPTTTSTVKEPPSYNDIYGDGKF